jgi:hypothetical protein
MNKNTAIKLVEAVQLVVSDPYIWADKGAATVAKLLEAELAKKGMFILDESDIESFVDNTEVSKVLSNRGLTLYEP